MDAITTEKEVKECFDGLVSAINAKDAGSWSGYLSTEGFLSAVAGTDAFSKRSAWIEAVEEFFSARESQSIEPGHVRVAELAPGLALLTSEQKTEFALKAGGGFAGRHVFTMIWKKEPDGWKIVHSHESWSEG